MIKECLVLFKFCFIFYILCKFMFTYFFYLLNVIMQPALQLLLWYDMICFVKVVKKIKRWVIKHDYRRCVYHCKRFYVSFVFFFVTTYLSILIAIFILNACKLQLLHKNACVQQHIYNRLALRSNKKEEMLTKGRQY